MRMINRADASRQPCPYMWVLPAESPLALRLTLRSQAIPVQGKSGILGGVGGKLRSSVLGQPPLAVRDFYQRSFM